MLVIAALLVALVHYLGRPARFLNMLRVVKVTSPMSVGSWLLAGFMPAAGVAAGCALTGRLPRTGAAATAGSAVLGPAVAAYPAALISDTAVPAWHDGYRDTGTQALRALSHPGRDRHHRGHGPVRRGVGGGGEAGGARRATGPGTGRTGNWSGNWPNGQLVRELAEGAERLLRAVLP